MKRYHVAQKIMAMALALVMVLGMLPVIAFTTNAAVNPAAVVQTDPGTAQSWEQILGSDIDGNRYAGRVWVDKSVYQNGQTVLLDSDGTQDYSSFVVELDEANGEYFQTVFSALGSSMSTNTSVTTSRPLDVVLVLDTSTSMTTSTSGKSRLQHMIEAANKLLEDLLALGDVRIAIVSFNRDSETVIELAKYGNGIVLSTNHYTNTNGGGIIYARDKSGTLLGNDSGYQTGTNLQDGIDRGMDILAAASNTAGRMPVAIVLADGRANRAVNLNWHTPTETNRKSSGDAGIMLSTLLNAAYGRARVEKNYGTDMTVYGVGIDLSSSSNDYIFLNPGAAGSSGFNSSNTDSDVAAAWEAFTTWKEGNTATIKTGSGRNETTWTFDHNWPASANVTTAEVADNIAYVDKYQDVTSATLGTAFDEIVEQLSTGAFNPITSTTTGATGVEGTPLIFTDNIGKYMQIKSIQAVHLFGETYPVVDNGDGTYTVTAGTGRNPTTGESWNTASDIQIQVSENADGTQRLRIYINQQILPITLDEVNVTSENGVTTSTLDVYEQRPLRVFYTVGIDSDVLLPSGQVDPTKIASDYAYVDAANGTVDFYSNAFGSMNTADADKNGMVERGDAHVGFVPSHNNRYYYHQAAQEIFISATNLDGSSITWEAGEYGVRWDPTKYTVKAMSAADLATISDSTTVYTYVTFFRPTGSGNAAEEVTYLVYTTWGDIKSAATFYDKVNNVALNGGSALDPATAGTVAGEYAAENGLASTDLIAILGLQSRRVSRLHNMYRYKDSNDTGTAELSYAPAYSDTSSEAGDIHEHSEVIVWLGNNGKLTLPIASGLEVTKDVTEVAEGAAADEKFAISVALNLAYTDETLAGLVITDATGVALDSSVYTVANNGGNILVTLQLADGQTARILGLPGGTAYTVTEAEHTQYSGSYLGATQTVSGTVVSGTVTNAPIKPGTLFITKEVQNVHGAGYAVPTEQEFDFEVKFVDADGDPIANHTFDIVNNHDGDLTRTTDANGVMTGKLRHGETAHILGIPAGATVTVTEVNIPTGFALSPVYSSIDYSGDTADADGTVTIVAEHNATVVVRNTYTPDPVSVEIAFTGTKLFDATKMVADSTFTFKLQQYVNGAWADVNGKSVTIPAGTNASEAFSFDTLTLDLTAPGSYSCQIVEVRDPSDPNYNSDVTYDRSVYTFSVDVTVDANGNLQAQVVGYNTGENFSVTGDATDGYTINTVFTNQYHTAATSVDIVKNVTDNANSGKTPAGFVIETYEASVDAEGNWIIGDFIRSTETDAQGEARLVRNYDNTDFEKNDTDGDNIVTYHFIIKEKNAGASGWTYDTAQYQLTVVLTRDPGTSVITAQISTGEVTAESTNSARVTFHNTYDPDDAEVDLNIVPTVTKHLEGRNFKAGEFTFAIFPDGQASHTSTEGALAVGTNDESGNVFFSSNLTFSKVGRYYYDVVEINGGLGGVTYDETIYDLVVEVVDDGNGKLSATYFFEDSTEAAVTFHNTYYAQPTQVTINGTKVLQVESGVKGLHAGDYTFGLYDANGNQLETATNDAAGNFKFLPITYTLADAGKIFTYTVSEIAGSAPGITYDTTVRTVTVTVVDNGDGTLRTEVTGNGPENLHFTNTYYANPVTVTLPGKKTMTGRTLADGEFRFALYQADMNFENQVLVSDTTTHNAEGEFTMNLGTLGMGTYYFVVREYVPEYLPAGVYYSGAEYQITVTVTDDGHGQMTYTRTIVNPGAEDPYYDTLVFNNLYRPVPTAIDLPGIKTVTNEKPIADGDYAFELVRDDDVIAEATVKADGTFLFEDVVFTADDIGENTLQVREKIPAGATQNADGTWTLGTITFDPDVHTLVVTVSDVDKDGYLETSYAVNGTANVPVAFENIHTPDPISHQLEAQKIYEKGLKGEDFAFKLEGQINGTKVEQTKKNDASGKIVFDPVTFTEAGAYTFTIKEKKDGILSFIRPSEAEYEVTVNVVNEAGVLRVISTNVVNTKNTGEGNLEFVNTYLYEGEDQVVVTGTKTLTGDRTTVEGGEFSFGLYDSEGKLLETVKNDADGKIRFSPLVYGPDDAPMNGQSQYVYTVREIAGDNARYTYDETVYTVTVTVKDNDEGGVEASYTVTSGGEAAEIIFRNTYTDPTPVTYAPTAKKIYNKAMTGGEFTFKLEGQINGTKVEQTKTNAADGTVTFDALSFPEAGTYSFTVKEVGKVLGFISYSKAEHTIVVEVIDTKGVLSIGAVTVNADTEGTVDFVNTYVLDGEGQVTLTGTKTVTGDRTTVSEGEFSFGLYDAEGKLLETVKNDAAGKFAFSTLTFDETHVAIDGESTYIYTVKEIPGDNARYTYDEAVYTVTVTVRDNDQGGIAVSHEITENGETAEIAFENVYTDPTPVTYAPTAKKIYNKAMTGGEFTFKLEGQINGTKVEQTKTNAADGIVTFDALSFPEAGTYSFTVKEVGKVLGFISYSKAEHTIVVEVIDTKGVLSIGAVTVNADTEGTVDFVNTYVLDGEGQVTLTGTKTVTGDRTTVSEGEFSFGLYDSEGKLLETVKNDAAGKFAFSTLTFDESHVAIDGESTYIYTVKEIPGAADVGITYDETVYTVTVTVKDNDEGGVAVTHSITNGTEAAELAFRNTYTVSGTAKLELTGTKELLGGKPLADGAFAFGLYDGDQLLSKAENVSGKFTLVKEFTARQLGSYTYTVAEILPEGAVKNEDGTYTYDHITYDPTVYTVQVDVTDNGVGGIDLAYRLVDAETIAFTNVYTPDPAVITVNVDKILDNRTEKNVSLAGFQFQIALGKNTYTAESDAAGKSGFTVTFDEDDVGKTYTFQVTEKNTRIKGMTYDKTVHTVTVQVLQNEDGSLKTVINGQEASAVSLQFTNIYEELVTPPLGDNVNLILPLALMVLSILGVAVILITRKRRVA